MLKHIKAEARRKVCGRFAEAKHKTTSKAYKGGSKAEGMRKICGKYAIAIGAEERRKFRGRSAEAKKCNIYPP